jgi:hypothetical protein
LISAWHFWGIGRIVVEVKYLTKQEQIVLGLTIALVLTGWVVKVYRASHPSAPAVWKQKS